MPVSGSPIRARALLLGVLLIPLNSYWVAVMEAIKYTGHPTTYSLYFNAVFCLLVLSTLSGLVGRIRPSWALSRAELLCVYFMICIGSALVGHDQAQVLLSVVLHPHQYLTPENGWETLFLPHAAPSLLVADPNTLEAVFEGHATIYDPDVIRGLVKPLFWWSCFWVALLVCFASLSVILRRQWADSEKLTFPLVALPFEMTQPEFGFFRNRLMWIGFVLPCLLQVVNNLHQVWPGVPLISSRGQYLSNYLTTPPWNAIGWSPLWLHPWAVGVGYLLPLDVLFSSWVFWWYWKAQAILASALGLGKTHPMAPYIPEQALGAYLGIAAIVTWSARAHLRAVLRAVARGPQPPGQQREALGYRAAVLAFAAGLAFLLWFSVHFKMELIPSALFLFGYLGITIAILRLRAEFGAPVHDLHFADPGLVMVHIAGPLSFKPSTLVGFSMYWWFNRAHRSHPGPFFMESFVGADRTGASQRRMLLAMALAVLVGIPAAYWGLLEPTCVIGAESAKSAGAIRGFGSQTWGQLATWLRVPSDPDPAAGTAIGAGFLVALALFMIRIRFVGFPLHPVGYGISSTWSMGTVWLPLAVAWAIKRTIVSRGGLRGYRAALPFFLGVLFGDFVSGAIANLIGVAGEFKPYHFLG